MDLTGQFVTQTAAVISDIVSLLRWLWELSALQLQNTHFLQLQPLKKTLILQHLQNSDGPGWDLLHLLIAVL